MTTYQKQRQLYFLGYYGGKIDGVNEFVLPGGDKRAIINVKKISHIPPKFPRVSAQIAKKPL